MSDTPMTDNVAMKLEFDGIPDIEWVEADFARELERQLAEAQKREKRLLNAIEELNAGLDPIRKGEGFMQADNRKTVAYRLDVAVVKKLIATLKGAK